MSNLKYNFEQNNPIKNTFINTQYTKYSQIEIKKRNRYDLQIDIQIR